MKKYNVLIVNKMEGISMIQVVSILVILIMLIVGVCGRLRALIIGTVFIILLFIFSRISSASNRRRFPISTEFMSVSGNRADTLGYMITNTKGEINKKPYQDFNFTAGGTWDLN